MEKKNYKNNFNNNEINGKSSNINRITNYSDKDKWNKDKEIEKLKNIIKNLKGKNSILYQENRYLKLQLKQMKNNKINKNYKNNYFQPNEKNYIYAEYIISDNDINQEIRILNHDEIVEDYDYDDSYGCGYNETGTDNKEEIEDSCLIYFGKKPIHFTETFNFYKPGKYYFIFYFKYKLTNINHLFYDCENLYSVDFSHFDSSSIKEFDSLFKNCNNLKYIDFSNFYISQGKLGENIFYGVHKNCRLISKDNSLIKKFESDKDNYEHKDDYYYDDFD